MSNIKKIKLSTLNLELVPISMDYVKDMFQEFTDKITKFMKPESPTKIKDTKEFIKSAIAKMTKGEELQMVIVKKYSHEFLGCAGLHKINTETPELGIWIKQSAHRHGYGREAITALKKWADSNLQYKYLRYPVDIRNTPSRKIPESLGGIIETKEYSITTPKGRVLKEVEYRIYKE